MPRDRRIWMYNPYKPDGAFSEEYIKGVKKFISRGSRYAMNRNHVGIRCPCKKCLCDKFGDESYLEDHIFRYGFMRDYEVWIFHGEKRKRQCVVDDVDRPVENNDYVNMVNDGFGAFGIGFVGETSNQVRGRNTEPPNAQAANYYKLMDDANEPLYEGCERFTKLSMCTELVTRKVESKCSQDDFEQWVGMMKGCCPDGGKNIPSNFYQAKTMLKGLLLPKVKIDCCVDGCMLFYKEDSDLSECKFCGQDRYTTSRRGSRKRVGRSILTYMPLAPRLQRLFMCSKTAGDMTWHATTQTSPGYMQHPRDGGAWKHFDEVFPGFAAEQRNVRIGLCTDGFSAFASFGTAHSCWPVICCVYNLPPGMCMKEPFLFLPLILPGPKSPGKNLDVYLRPLIDELNVLWDDGVLTYDSKEEQNFVMRVALMWTISDFPAYGMLSGWSTHGKLACPYCMGENPAIRLTHGKKQSWFDCTRIFLPRGHSFRNQKNAFVRGKTCHRHLTERPDGFAIYQDVCGLDENVFGQGREATRRSAGLDLIIYLIFRLLDTFGSDILVHNAGFGTEHNWTKKSIFWDLPYWQYQKLRHNIDFMHTEKNNGDNFLFTLMDVPTKTKDTERSREDIALICSRQDQHNEVIRGKPTKPKAKYTLDANQQKAFRLWMSKLKLPDGYASNIARCAGRFLRQYMIFI